MITNQPWNAVYTRRNYEKKVCSFLEKKGIAYYCPLNHALLKGGNQKKQIANPLFPSIIFVQVPETTSIAALARVPYVTNLLYRHSQPAFFPAQEIEAIRKFVEGHENIMAAKIALGVADQTYAKETEAVNYSLSEKIYTIDLHSIGYRLSAKAKEQPVTNVKLLRKNAGRYTTSERLALILSFRNNGGKVM